MNEKDVSSVPEWLKLGEDFEAAENTSSFK